MARNGTLLEGCHTGEAGMVRVALSRGEDPNPVVLGLWQVAEQRINDATFDQGFTCSFFSLPDLSLDLLSAPLSTPLEKSNSSETIILNEQESDF